MEKLKIFLDLEDTVIQPVLKGWANVDLLPLERVKNFINSFESKDISLNIFSFALHSQTDVERFSMFVRPTLEEQLGLKFEWIPDSEMIKNICCQQMNIHPDRVDFMEMVDFWGKQLSFQITAQNFIKKSIFRPSDHIVLLDDAVVTTKMTIADVNILIKNVDEL